MKFRGDVLAISALLELPDDRSASSSEHLDSRVLHRAADNALRAAQLIAEGEPLDDAWRFEILPTLDDYTSTAKRGGTALASSVLSEEPAPTGAAALDAAFAALADHLAERDGWRTPSWALDPTRRVLACYPAVPSILHEEADRDSPRAFRTRGILITERSLARA